MKPNQSRNPGADGSLALTVLGPDRFLFTVYQAKSRTVRFRIVDHGTMLWSGTTVLKVPMEKSSELAILAKALDRDIRSHPDGGIVDGTYRR